MKIIEKIEALNALSKGINPTIVYNEGWMVRLLVMQSIEEKIEVENINFGQFQNWTSEAQILSPFQGSELKKVKLNETRTHTDIIIGDFDIDFDNDAGVLINKQNAKIVGIIEAKMGSDLSQGVTNAKEYNQVSRSICCLAYNAPKNCKIFVFVAAPKSTLEKHKIPEQICDKTIRDQIDNRLVETNNGNIPNIEDFIRNVTNCVVKEISFEDWIEKIVDGEVKNKVDEFYKKCKIYNKIK
jgi:hypothetical protein